MVSHGKARSSIWVEPRGRWLLYRTVRMALDKKRHKQLKTSSLS